LLAAGGGSNVEIARSSSIDAGSEAFLRKPVALGQGGHFIGADSLDQSVVLFPDSWLGSGTAGHSSKTSSERSNEVLAVSRCPASSSFRPVSKCWSDWAIRSATGSVWECGAGAGAVVLRNRGRRLRGMRPLLVSSAPDREQRDEAHPPRQAATCRRHDVNVL
jgi:hypothetical protein